MDASVDADANANADWVDVISLIDICHLLSS